MMKSRASSTYNFTGWSKGLPGGSRYRRKKIKIIFKHAHNYVKNGLLILFFF